MAKELTEQQLRKQAVRATESLGPVDALRFLASREPFDYQQWRKEYFSHYDVDELIEEAKNTPHQKSEALLRFPGADRLSADFALTAKSWSRKNHSAMI